MGAGNRGLWLTANRTEANPARGTADVTAMTPDRAVLLGNTLDGHDGGGEWSWQRVSGGRRRAPFHRRQCHYV